jgi:ferritin-like metal-binding protein YciE
MQAETLEDVLQRDLEFAYDCEQHLMHELPKIAEAVNSRELRMAFEQQLEQTGLHLARLDQIFSWLNRPAGIETNHVIRSIVGEGNKLIKHINRSPLLDAALIAAASQAAHYEIALYGSLCSFARALNLDDSASLLQQTLNEEKQADQAFARIAEDSVNREALQFHNTPHIFPLL